MTYRMGQRFMHPRHGEMMLAQIDFRVMRMVILNTGNRYYEAFRVKDTKAITETEMNSGFLFPGRYFQVIPDTPAIAKPVYDFCQPVYWIFPGTEIICMGWIYEFGEHDGEPIYKICLMELYYGDHKIGRREENGDENEALKAFCAVFYPEKIVIRQRDLKPDINILRSRLGQTLL